MAIDRSGQWYRGSEPVDAIRYVLELETEGYAITEGRLAVCSCSDMRFSLRFDGTEGVAERICSGCKGSHFICDSGDFAADAELVACTCLCGRNEWNIAVGFSFFDGPEKDVRWITVAHRCVACGVLGSCVDWKAEPSDSSRLLENI